MTMTGYYGDNTAQIDGALVIGKSSNVDPVWDMINDVSPRGIYLAAREDMVVKNVKFYNFDFNWAAAFGTCSHCTQPEDKGTRTSTVSNIWFDDATVPRRIKYDFPFRHIIYDLDGTTTGKGEGSWATFYYLHN
jgi:hypothetical protein